VQRFGLRGREIYERFQAGVDDLRDAFLGFLLDHRSARIVGYGAAAKGNTLLNFAGVRPDLLPYVVDRNPAKAGSWMPGSRIPIVGEDVLRDHRPDRILILPWNLRSEIKGQLADARDWGAKFVVAVPRLEVA